MLFGSTLEVVSEWHWLGSMWCMFSLGWHHLQEASDKLEALKAEELKNTKVNLNTEPSDTIQFDNLK